MKSVFVYITSFFIATSAIAAFTVLDKTPKRPIQPNVPPVQFDGENVKVDDDFLNTKEIVFDPTSDPERSSDPRVKPDLESFVGRILNFSGIDVDYNEASLETTRGKYVVVYFVPKNSVGRKEVKETALKLADVLQEFDSEKFAVVEYVEQVDGFGAHYRRDLREPEFKAELDELRARPWLVVAEDLSLRANLAFNANYPLFFRTHNVYRDLFALVAPNGLVLAVDSDLSVVKKRLQIIENRETQRANQ